MTNDPAVIEEILDAAHNIAVVGMSDKPSRASHHVGLYLAQVGYRLFPVNPLLERIGSLSCYASIAEADAAARVATGKGIDLLDVFRASEFVPAIAEDAICLGIPYLWLQDGVRHEEAIARARAVGVKCVQDDCIFRQRTQRRP